MNYVIIFLLQLVVFQNMCPSPKPEVLIATRQEYAGGHIQAGRGVKFKFEIKANADSENISFTYLWVNGKKVPLTVFKKGGNMQDTLFGEDDIIVAVAQIHEYPENPERNVNWIEEKFPIKSVAEGVIGYIYKNKTKFKEVQEFTVLNPENRP